MTREEEIIETAKSIYSPSSGIPQSLPMRVGFIEGAKWADATMIEKACKWLNNVNTDDYMIDNVFQMCDFIRDFRKSMEE